MNGAHDLGGMHGFGAIESEPNEPVFHADWERRVFALAMAMRATGEWTIDRGRLDAALLDVRVNGHDVYPVVDVLMGRGIHFIFVSGFSRKQIPPRYRDCAYIAKPFTPQAILALLEEVVRGGRPQPRTGPR